MASREGLRMGDLLERALPLLRCPACGDPGLARLPDAAGLRCAACGRRYPCAGGVVDLYTGPEIFTPAQRSLQTRLTTGLYDRFRWLLARAVIGYRIEEEVVRFRQALDLRAGDVLLDVACGPGNFTVPLARVAHPGLVIGLDISPAQLARAAARRERSGLDNVLLVRGDVHRLPLRDGAMARVSCAGGLHQFPELPRALAEVARVLAPGGRFAGSTLARHPGPWARPLQDWLCRRYAVHFLDLVAVGGLAARAGLSAYAHEPAPSPWFGYCAAVKA